MSMFSHTPPVFQPGSLNPMMKRARSGSISKRLCNAAEMCQDVQVDREAQGALKDMIIRDDPQLQHVMRRIEEGDKKILREMLADGILNNVRKLSSDVLGDGDLKFESLNVNDTDPIPTSSPFGGVSATGTADCMYANECDDGGDDFGFMFEMSNDKNMFGPKPVRDMSRLRSNSLRSTGRDPPQHIMLRSRVNSRKNSISGSSGNFGPKAPVVKTEPKPIKPARQRDNRQTPEMGKYAELFDFQLFDDSGVLDMDVAGNGGASPGINMSMDGTTKSSNMRLHRDSIAQLDDLLLPPANGFKVESFNSMVGGGSLDEDMKAIFGLSCSQPIRIPVNTMNKGGQRMRNRHKLKGDFPLDNKSRINSSVVKNGLTNRDNTTGYGQHHKLNKGLVVQGFTKKSTGSKIDQAGRNSMSRNNLKPKPVNETKVFKNSSSIAIQFHSPPKMSAQQALELSASVTPASGYVGGYSPDSRCRRIEKFLQKRNNRMWMKRVKYDVRKNFADSRLRVKGRFVKKEGEEALRELIIMAL